ncbi:hypothetical protein BN2475_550025 [Paraburkholderia ribeironis]|uniref:Uncharacterized protein n=1 Tax=Paraburkholderia ribeironis TaxID=1247936 RepID=A0A1N7SDD9_9BURK|nr:hypothetical protein BN2475_550025 [Paraburkholderia ribeironis]
MSARADGVHASAGNDLLSSDSYEEKRSVTALHGAFVRVILREPEWKFVEDARSKWISSAASC